jgi:spore coat protein U-like protein
VLALRSGPFVLALLACLCGRAEAILCSFSTSSLAFGNYLPTSPAPTTGTGAIAITCLLPSTVVLALSTGQGNSFTPRVMAGPDSLNYNLFVDSGDTHIWGDGTGTTQTVTMTFGLLTPPQPVYGAIPPMQNASVGSYADTVIVTATF